MFKNVKSFSLFKRNKTFKAHKQRRWRKSEDGSRVSLCIKPPDGGWGWVIVVASFFASMLADGITYSYGVLATEFIRHFGISRSTVGWMGSTLFAITLGSGPLASYLSKRFTYRFVSLTGSLICSIGFAAPYFYAKLWFVFLSSSVIGGLGFGLVYLPSVVIVNEWFEKKRAIALGIAVCGSGLGTVVFSPLMEYLIERYGWQGCMLILGLILLLLIICCMTYIDVEIEEKEIEIEESETESQKNDRKTTKEEIIKYADINNCNIENAEKREIQLTSNFELLKTPLFMLLSVSMLLTGLGFDAPYMFAKDRAMQLGIPSNRSSLIISFIGLGNMVGRIVFGIVASSPCINRFHLYNFSLMAGGIVLISNWDIRLYALMLLNAFIFGTLTGTFVTLSSIILVDLFGLENLNISFGLSSIFQAVAVLLGPPLIGFIYDKTRSYNIAYTACGISIFISGAIMYLAYFSSNFRKIKFYAY